MPEIENLKCRLHQAVKDYSQRSALHPWKAWIAIYEAYTRATGHEPKKLSGITKVTQVVELGLLPQLVAAAEELADENREPITQSEKSNRAIAKAQAIIDEQKKVIAKWQQLN